MKERGVSLVEMIAVLLLLGIVSSVVISRVANVDDMELATEVNSIRNHIRYAQIMAMKRNDKFWGIKFNGNEYWVFRTADPTDVAAPNLDDNIVYLPGSKNKKLSKPGAYSRTFYFDKFGIPYDYATGLKISNAQTIQFSTKALTLTPETGYVR